MAKNARLRIGVLGAAAVVPMALAKPAREVPEVEVAAVAARERGRAERLARRLGIPRVHDSYAALLADPELDAVYVPLPNSLHAEWSLRALAAGKHVLCEKPFTSNAGEAEAIAREAAQRGLVVSEGFAYRYHPLSRRLLELIDSGEIGAVRRLQAEFCYANPMTNNIRFRLELAGGATMDAGCYPVSLLRFVARGEPEVLSARALLFAPEVDRRMEAELSFPGGVSARLLCAILSPIPFRSRLIVTGEAGSLTVINPYHPHWFHSLRIEGRSGRRRERVRGDNVYAYQLRAFAAAIRGESGLSTGPEDAIANMRVIDAIYRKAGLHPRGTTG